MPEMNDLLEQNKKQIEFLQRQCRKAGKAIIDQETTIAGLKKETNVKIDAIDLRESENLKEIESLKNVKILTLCNFFGSSKNHSKHFDKLKDLKRIYLVNSHLNLGKKNKIEIINKSIK